ncbi:MAG TPA: non-homologous end-joining DNA ligase [Streptosporangiaceae bacterium]|nr:non-homologous end-joining DNA ligase [Streptosporangiaceae bacterium]
MPLSQPEAPPEPPAGLRPMLATAGPLPADDTGWAYEMKWDGLRALAFLSDGAVRLTSRTGRDITHTYPELARAPALTGARRVVLDGEIVAFGGGSWPDFEALQQRMNIGSAAQAAALSAQIPVSYLAFDVLWLDGLPLLDRPYARRREVLDGLGLHGGRWQVPPSFTGESGADIQAVSVQQRLEGVVAKRLGSRYEPGRRSPAWRKIKNVFRQEVVVGGWKPGEGGRSGWIGSLLVGVYAGADLVYCGHVGTGFTQQTLRMLGDRLAVLRRDTSPFAGQLPAEDARFARWVEPLLVAEVAFTGWTKSGRLRGPAYKGLRDDKDAAEVVRES